MQFRSTARLRVTGALSLIAVLLSGCATLPSSGPTGRQVIKGAEDPANPLKFQIVELDGAAFQKLLTIPPAGRGAGQIAALARTTACPRRTVHQRRRRSRGGRG